ncbi:MAG TPA: MFS transporter, partial [Thermomicrobiales bacterium]|nr:MFS transporter [Thermomicrobiales bacterium]
MNPSSGAGIIGGFVASVEQARPASVIVSDQRSAEGRPRVPNIPMPAMMRDRTLRLILLLAAMAGGAFGLTIPFLTLVARERGVSLGAIGIMASSYLVAQTILQLPFGSLSDRIGRTTPIAAGFAVEALASFGFVFADSAATFIGLRVLQGVSLALIMPSLRALVADVTPVSRRGQAYAWIVRSSHAHGVI